MRNIKNKNGGGKNRIQSYKKNYYSILPFLYMKFEERITKKEPNLFLSDRTV